jgi:hypothetical protein
VDFWVGKKSGSLGDQEIDMKQDSEMRRSNEWAVVISVGDEDTKRIVPTRSAWRWLLGKKKSPGDDGW